MQKTKKILALLLVVALTVTQLPVAASAASTGEGGEIIVFDTLPEKTANQTVTLGTSLEDLDLPNTLNATVRMATDSDTEVPEPEANNELVRDSGEPQQPEESSEPAADAGSEGEGESEAGSEQPEHEPDKPEQAPAEPKMTETGIPVPVEWVSSPDYDGEKVGTYIFIAQIEDFMVSAAPPSITVTVGEITDTVTAFEELSDDIRWQNTVEPVFPETVGGTVEGEAVQISVSWQTEQDYDENAPAHGLYVFDAVPGEGYTLVSGTITPRITVYIPAQRMMMRMGGDGTSGSALEITTAAQLIEIAELVNAGRLESFLFNNSAAAVYLEMKNDLDLSAYGKGWNGGKGWMPIGTAANPFKGHFDGGGNSISGLYINDPALSNAGLFGSVEGGMVQGLALSDVSVRGATETGGIAGRIKNTTVEKCGVTGSVNGNATVGGVAGLLLEGASIKNSYSIGSVTGTGMNVGGIAGKLNINTSIVQNCYSTAAVEGSLCVGGIVGDVGLGGKDCIKDCAALNPSINAGGTNVGRVVSKDTPYTYFNNAAFQDMLVRGSTVTSVDGSGINGADITAAQIKADGTIGGRLTSANGWTVADGKLPGFGVTVEMPPYIIDLSSGRYFLGEGTSGDPYQIATADQLAKLAELVNSTDEATHNTYNSKSYKLTNDIDLSAYGKSYDDNKGWKPIGGDRYDADTGIHDVYTFNGSFDGGGHKITGLYINRPEERYVGLFGGVWCDTVILDIKNLGLEGVSIVGGEYVGGVAGYAKSYIHIKSCYVTGSVSGAGVGGIVGVCHENVIVRNCYSAASVSGTDVVGGITGYVYWKSMVEDCYSAASVSGSGNSIGGIAGCINGGTVQRCYATGSVEGTSGVGGIVGQTNGKLYSSIALNPSVTGQGYVGRVVGDNTEGNSTGNYAFSGMTDPGAGKFGESSSHFDKNGADADAATIIGDIGGAISNRFYAAEGWTYQAGKLPVLTGLDCQDDTLPYHIIGNYFIGDGSPGDPFQIATASQLAKLAGLVNAGNANYNSKYYKLTDNLDLSGYGASNTGFNGGKGWVPIGTKTNKFQGHFDGNHKTITGLYIHDDDGSYYSANGGCGLFGSISGGTVQKLFLSNVYVHGYAEIGGIAGEIQNTVVSACGVSGSVHGTASGGAYVGGVVGYVGDNGKVENSYSTGSVSGGASSANIGGITGCLAFGTSSLQNCYSTTKVEAGGCVGGIVGATWSYNSVIKNCAALNPAISEGVGNGGRVLGRDIVPYPGKLAGNRAFSGMIGGGSYKTADGTDGADMTVKQMFDASFWTNASNWEGAAWSGTIWDFQNDKLPILAGFAPGTQSGDGGLYLIERDIAKATVDTGGPYTYNGSPIETTLSVTFGGETLVSSVDYTANYSNNINAGTANVSVTGKGNYTGTLNKTFIIAKAAPNVGTVSYNSSDVIYPTTAVATVSDKLQKNGSTTGTLALAMGTAFAVGTKGYTWNFTPADSTNYYTATGTIQLTVMADSLSSIVVTTAPTKMTYVYGDTFEPMGMVVTATYASGGTKTLSSDDYTIGYTNGGSHFAAGETSVTLSYIDSGINRNCYVTGLTVNKATVKCISTTVSDVSKTSYEMRNATTEQAVVNASGLPTSVSVTTDSGAAATLPIIWSTTTAYNAKGTTYQVTGTLTGNANIDVGSFTKIVNITVTPITTVNPAFGDMTVLVNSHGGSATASALETADILRTSGSISVQGEDISYAISWNGGPLDTTSAGNSATFTGTISYPGAPAWLTLPSNFTVSRKVTVTAKTAVTISGISTPNKTYDGAAYVPSGTVSVNGGSVPTNELVWLYTSTYSDSYSSTVAPTNAGAYKLTISVPDSNANYTGSEAFTFTIEKRQITLTADNKTATKGGSLPNLTYTIGNLVPRETASDALNAEPTLNCPTFNGNTLGNYPIMLSGGTAAGNYTITDRFNGTLTVAEQTYSVTFNLRGGTRTGGGALTQTVPEGGTAVAPTVTRSGYTLTGWDKTFENVTSNLTVTANWSYNGGSGSGSGGDDYIHRVMTDSATGIMVSGNISEDVVLAVSSLSLGSDAASDAIRQRMNDEDYVFLLGKNISLSGGFSGTLTISLPVGAQYNGETVTILHAKQDGTLETYTVVVQDGKATFSVTSLSPFAAFIKDGLDDIPKTGDDSSPWVWWLLCGVSAAEIGLITALNALGKRRKLYRR